MVEQTPGKKFVSDLAIYTLGNLGAKVMTFAMVPIYTYFVERPSDFGYYDLCMTVCLLLFPVVSLRLRDSAVRFLLNTRDEDVAQRTRVVSGILRVFISSLLLWLMIALAVRVLYGSTPFMGYSLLYLIVDIVLALNVQIARGLGENKFFAAIGIITSLLIFVFTIVFLVLLKMGVEGIFLSNILARVCAIVITECHVKAMKRFLDWKVDIKLISKSLLSYSVPLIPTALCWWLTGANGRFFISHFLGIEYNGLYAVAMRFISLFDTISYIFGTAWQETAIRQYGKQGSEQFFSKILTSYVVVLCGILILGAFGFKILYPAIVAPAYKDSVNYLYIMGIAAVFYALASFFELGYHCAKETKRTIMPILIMGVINLVANFVLVQLWGIYGICLSSCFSYAFLLIYRWLDTKRYFVLHLNSIAYVPVLLSMVSLAPYYLLNGLWLNLAYMLFVMLVLAFFIPAEAKQILTSKVSFFKHQ